MDGILQQLQKHHTINLNGNAAKVISILQRLQIVQLREMVVLFALDVG